MSKKAPKNLRLDEVGCIYNVNGNTVEYIKSFMENNNVIPNETPVCIVRSDFLQKLVDDLEFYRSLAAVG